MTRYLILIFLVFNFLITENSYAQDKKISQLVHELPSIKDDSVKILNLYLIADYYSYNNPDSSIYYLNHANQLLKSFKGEYRKIYKADIEISLGWNYFNLGEYSKAIEYLETAINTSKSKINTKDSKYHNDALSNLSDAYINRGIVAYSSGEYSVAMKYYHLALAIKQKQKDTKSLIQIYGNMALVYRQQGDFAKSLEFQQKGLKQAEKIKSLTLQSNSLGNIGNIYFSLARINRQKCACNDDKGNFNKALNYYQKAYQISIKTADHIAQANHLGNIGLVYSYQEKYENAIEIYSKVLLIFKEINHQNGTANTINHIASIYQQQEKYHDALEKFNEALKIFKEIGNKRNEAISLGYIGQIYLKTKSYQKAEKYLLDAMNINLEIGNIDFLKDNYESLAELYEKLNKPNKALKFYKEFIVFRDSLNKQEQQQEVFKKEIQYEYEKKSSQDSLENVKAIALKNTELKQQKTEMKAKKIQQYFLYSIIFIVLIFLGFILNRYKIIRKQNILIDEKEKNAILQKDIIEAKHNEIKDSIIYAERIQRSFLASNELLKKHFKEHFIFYQPKDGVSGDFYWASELKNNNFLFCCADSTGHGVPGAIMSIFNITTLEKVIETENIPNEILNQSRKRIIQQLKKDGSLEGGKDGMDCSLLSFNFSNMHLQFALAQHNLIIIRNHEIIEFKGDKMPVGKHDFEDKPFSLYEFELKENDEIYLFTDGYVDQFGGPKGKKYLSKNLKEFLLSIHNSEYQYRLEKISTEYQNWKGDLEQIDDVCVLGIKI